MWDKDFILDYLSRGWKSQGNRLFSKAPEGTIALPHLNFSPLRPSEL